VCHVLAGERVRQPVVDHRVDRLAVAHPDPKRAPVTNGALDIDSIPAGHRNIKIADVDRRIKHPCGPHRGRADFVDRLRGDLLRDPRVKLRLREGI